MPRNLNSRISLSLMTPLKNARPSASMCATVCLCVCVWSYFNTFLIFILINVHLSTCHEQFQSSTRIRRRRSRQESRKSSSGRQRRSKLPACSTCYVQPRPRSPLCSSLCPLPTRPLQNVVCLAQLARTRIDVAHTFQDLCT